MRKDYIAPPWSLLAGSFFISLFLCLAQIRGSQVMIILAIAAFLILSVAACRKKIILCVLLYFLPWSPLLKMQPGGTSFFTIALIAICLYGLVIHRFELKLYQILLPSLLVALTMTAKAIEGNSFSKAYLLFFCMLVLFPCATREIADTNLFYEQTVFFSVGIISAALTAQRAAGYTNISRYINVASYLNITRLSGYYGDANFYCAQITACLAGIMLLLTRERRSARRFFSACFAVLLLYCGLLSASKSFIVTVAVEFFVWILLLLRRGNAGSIRFRILVGILATALFIASSSAFQGLLRMVSERFSFAYNISGLTTGRTDVWEDYLREFAYNPKLLLLGEGFTNITLDTLRNKATHNTILQGIYQFGILGFPLLMVWVYKFITTLTEGTYEKADIMAVLLLCAGTVLPWFGIDILFFDEFFLLPAFVTSGVMYYSEDIQDETEIVLE